VLGQRKALNRSKLGHSLLKPMMYFTHRHSKERGLDLRKRGAKRQIDRDRREKIACCTRPGDEGCSLLVSREEGPQGARLQGEGFYNR